MLMLIDIPRMGSEVGLNQRRNGDYTQLVLERYLPVPGTPYKQAKGIMATDIFDDR